MNERIELGKKTDMRVVVKGDSGAGIEVLLEPLDGLLLVNTRVQLNLGRKNKVSN